MLRIFLLILLFFASSCRPRPTSLTMYGADEFVLDSYCIRQGKNAILRLEGECIGDLPCEAMLEYEDAISDDDLLNIAIYHPTRKDLSESIAFISERIGFRVTEGKIAIPDIPPVYVAGLTLTEAKEKLQKVFKEHIADIEVFLSYKDRLARKVDLAGMVHTSTMPVDGKIRLYEVLSKAGIPNNANFFMSYVERDGEKLPIDLSRLMIEGDMSQNIVMRGGDKIFIADPSEARAMIMGEVLRPTAITMPRGFVSLREAIVFAGGIPFTGDKRCIQVIRGNFVCPKVYLLSWKHIINLPNDSLLIIPGDTIYVSETPLTRWNRFISQLLPSVEGVSTSGSAYEVFIP